MRKHHCHSPATSAHPIIPHCTANWWVLSPPASHVLLSFLSYKLQHVTEALTPLQLLPHLQISFSFHSETGTAHHHQLPPLHKAPCSACPAQPGQSDQSSHSLLLLPCAGSIQTLCQLLPTQTQTAQRGGNLFFTPFYTYCGEVLISGWSQ